jgi:membrane protein DedA with SNARE-associated domain
MALGDLLQLIVRYGYVVVFLSVLAESAGVPLPGETVLIVAGVLVHRGVLGFGDALFFGILGTVVGDQIGYWVGRLGGRPFVLRWGKYAFITPERLGRAERFLPGTEGGPSSWPVRPSFRILRDFSDSFSGYFSEEVVEAGQENKR